MVAIFLLLLIGGLACFLLAVFGVTPPRVSLLALGLALWIAVDVIQKARQIN